MSIDDDSRDPTADERDRAEARRDAVEEGADDLVQALVASSRPRDIDAALHERILAKALGVDGSEEEPEPTAGERADATMLRRLLDGDATDLDDRLGPLVSLFLALKNAYAPRALDDVSGERILRPALAAASLRTRRAAVVIAFSAAIAVAAGVAALFFRDPGGGGGQSAQPSAALMPGMVEARSTEELFGPDDFAQGAEQTTERIDRISSSREADLRNNRFVAWGVP